MKLRHESKSIDGGRCGRILVQALGIGTVTGLRDIRDYSSRLRSTWMSLTRRPPTVTDRGYQWVRIAVDPPSIRAQHDTRDRGLG